MIRIETRPRTGSLEQVSDGQFPSAQHTAPVQEAPQDAVVIELSDKAKESYERHDAARESEPVVVELSVVETQDSSKTAEKPEVEQQEESSEKGGDKDDGEKAEELKERDQKVRAHEQAHLNALGAYRSGGASYGYETGPDGKQYATSGSVPVDVSPEDTPGETVRKAQTVKRAALAPKEPSGADRAVAAKAAQLETKARSEITEEQIGNTEQVSESEKKSEEKKAAEVSGTKNTSASKEPAVPEIEAITPEDKPDEKESASGPSAAGQRATLRISAYASQSLVQPSMGTVEKFG